MAWGDDANMEIQIREWEKHQKENGSPKLPNQQRETPIGTQYNPRGYHEQRKEPTGLEALFTSPISLLENETWGEVLYRGVK